MCTMSDMPPTLLAIRELLTAAGIPFTEKQHAPTLTSEESAAARGEPLHYGGKALLIKTDDLFRLFVLPADRKLDSAAVKRELGVKKSRFATADELFITSTSICLQPIVRVDGETVGDGRPGPLYRQLLTAWSEKVGVDIAGQALAFSSRS